VPFVGQRDEDFMDQLFALRAFVATARLQSVTRAAEDLGVSAGVVSRVLAGLEDRIQMRLLHRTTRVVKLNEDAEEYFHSCVQVLAVLDQATHRLTCEKNGDGHLRIAVHPMIPHDMLGRALREYGVAAPGVSVSVRVTDGPVNLVRERIDIGILPSALVDQGNVYRRTLSRTHRILVAAPSYLGAACPLQQATDLERHPLLLATAPEAGRERTLKVLESGNVVRVTVCPRIRGCDSVLRSGALAGAGIAWIPENLVADDLATGRLRRVLRDCELDEAAVDLCIFYLDPDFMSTRCRVFIELCVALFQHAGGPAVERKAASSSEHRLSVLPMARAMRGL
jgi:DNA-binding transcriptional LysR family regulator